MRKLFRIASIREVDPALADRIEAAIARQEAAFYRPIDDEAMVEAGKHIEYLQGKVIKPSKTDVLRSRGAFMVLVQKWVAESPRASGALLRYLSGLQAEVTNIQRAQKSPAKKAGRKKAK